MKQTPFAVAEKKWSIRFMIGGAALDVATDALDGRTSAAVAHQLVEMFHPLRTSWGAVFSACDVARSSIYDCHSVHDVIDYVQGFAQGEIWRMDRCKLERAAKLLSPAKLGQLIRAAEDLARGEGHAIAPSAL